MKAMISLLAILIIGISAAIAEQFSISSLNPGIQTFLRLKLTDQGSCTMAAGTCSAQALGSTYTIAPICFAIVTAAAGTPAVPLKAPSTTTTVTPATGGASDTSTVAWACFGN